MHRFCFRHWIAATLIALPLAACGALSKDPDGTLAAIEAGSDIRVAATAPLPPEVLRLLDRVQKRTRAIPRVQTGELEPLLARLDEGGVDLVVSPFREGSLLGAAAALSSPLVTNGQGEKTIEWRAATKNGSNCATPARRFGFARPATSFAQRPTERIRPPTMTDWRAIGPESPNETGALRRPVSYPTRRTSDREWQ